MPPSLEHQLQTLHRLLWQASNEAERLGRQDEASDLHMLGVAVGDIQRRISRPKRVRSTQTTLSDFIPF